MAGAFSLVGLAVVACSDDTTAPSGNQAPIATTPIAAQTIPIGDSATIDLSAHFGDPDGRALTFAAVSSDEKVATAAVLDSRLVVEAQAQGSAEITVTARDVGGLSVAQSFSVVVPNRPPVVVDSIPAVSIVRGDSVAIDLSAHFSDSDGDALTFAAVSSDEEAVTAAVSDSRLVLEAQAQGSAEITVTARDAGGLSVAQSFSAIVPNRAPGVVESIPALTIIKGDSATVELAPYFHDPDGDTLTFSAVSADEGVVAVAVSDGTLTVSAVARGTGEVTVTVRDPGGLEAATALSVTVPNRAPVVVDSISSVSMFRGDSATIGLSVHFSDPDEDTLAFTAMSSDDGVVYVAVEASTLTVIAVAQGSAEVTVTARDPGGLAASESFAVMVPNRAPVAVDFFPSISMVRGDTTNIELSAHFSDPDGDSLFFETENANDEVATVSVSGAAATVAAVAQGSTEVTVRARDPGGESASLSFKVSVSSDPDRAALVALYEAAGGPDWDQSGNWLTDAPLGNWHGVEVDRAGRVTELDLRYNRLEGTLPAQISRLARLKRLDLGRNALEGPIPAEFGRLADLELLGLWGNRLTGMLPPELGNLRKLHTLVLSHNDLVGALPPELGRLASLAHLAINNNRLAGPIPPELGGLRHLVHLRLAGNRLTGSIPPTLGSLARLEFLVLSENSLAGPIPPELGNLTSLMQLRLDSNDLTGPVPPELGGLANLGRLGLADNSLTGSIPRTFLRLMPVAVSLAGNAGLCVPGIPAFVAWLQEISRDAAPFCSDSDRAALASLYDLTGGLDWTNSAGWLDGVVLDRWHGVNTDSIGRVSALDLSHNNLVGRLPPLLGSLEVVTSLRIGGNALGGRLPQFLVNLPLREFHYDGTDLCVPSEEAFQTWLNTISSRRGTGVRCPALTDRDILSELYTATDGPGWANGRNWLTAAALDDWYGVELDDSGSVVSLDLSENGLAGSIPPILGLLRSLRSLDLHGNGLTGSIPPELGMLSSLELLQLGFNDLIGSIPPELGNLERLSLLDLIANRLTGQIPPSLGSLHNLDTLFIGFNSLTGPIPAELAGLADLKVLEAVANGLNGVIPPELASLSKLERLLLANNALTGAIPPELGSLGHLWQLNLAANHWSGSIPSELGELSRLQRLELDHSGLTGSIPPELGDLSELRYLLLQGNGLAGTIPPELGSLSRLNFLWLNDNSLTGTIPPDLGNLRALSRLTLSGNRLTGPIPPALGDLRAVRRLTLSNNRLTGPIPPQLGLANHLEELHLDRNNLTGPLPPELGDLADLTILNLTGNAGLSGPLPGSLTNLGQLESLTTGATDLCVPSDRVFSDWLARIPTQRVRRCLDGGSLAYLTQAVQSPDYPVPLVAGEEALLRVFVTAPRGRNARMPPVRARFHVDGNEVYVAEIPAQQSPIPSEVNESSLAGSANALIPPRVLQPGLELTVEVDPDNTLDSSLGVRKRIPETGRLAIDVQSMPILDLTLIPFVWTEEPDSQIVDLVRSAASDPDRHELLWAIRTLLPVSGLEVTAHPPVLSSSNNIGDVMNQTRMIRVLEGGAGHYMGTMSRFTGGFAGLANHRGRTSVGIPDAENLAHELGHNMGLLHAPCGGAGFVDPAFPSPDGRIGVWGFDLRAEGRLVQPMTADLMSYCGPRWISDYHFGNALRYRLVDEGQSAPAAAAATVRSLLLWGGREADGSLVLQPAFVVDARPALPGQAGDYRLEGTARDGRQLFAIDFEMPVLPDSDGAGSFAFALPVEPRWAGDLWDVTLTGPVGSVSLDGHSDHAMTILLDSGNGQVRGVLRHSPEANRVQAFGEAAPPSGSGLQVLFSPGIPGAEAWRR